MPTLLSEAVSHLLHQQNQIVLTTSTRQLYNYLIPTIINDTAIHERLLHFYLQCIPPYTICYTNKLQVHIIRGAFGRNAAANNNSNNTTAPPCDIFHLLIHGHLRHLTFFGTDEKYAGSFGSFIQAPSFLTTTTNNEREENNFIFTESQLKSAINIQTYKINIVELRFCCLRFNSWFDLGKIVSLLADSNSSTRASLEILDFSGCQFNRDFGGDMTLVEAKSSLNRDRAALLPGMKSSGDFLELRGLLELDLHEIRYDRDAAYQGIHCYFCFEMLPPKLQKLNISKMNGSFFKLHPAYVYREEKDGGSKLDWENMPKSLMELNMSGTGEEVLSSSTNRNNDAEDPRRIPFETFHPTSCLEVFKGSNSALGGSLLFAPEKTNRFLREIILIACPNLTGLVSDFITNLPLRLEVLSLTKCTGFGKMTTLNTKNHHQESSPYVVDLTQLPQTLKCLRLDWCNLTNFDNTNTTNEDLESNTNKNVVSPLDLTKLPESLQILSLSNNAFAGELDLTKLPSQMETLNLNFNQFEGEVNLRHLPKTMKFVDISHNRFVGYRMRKEDVAAMENGSSNLKVLARGMN